MKKIIFVILNNEKILICYENNLTNFFKECAIFLAILNIDIFFFII
jgi:hypothetical protein